MFKAISIAIIISLFVSYDSYAQDSAVTDTTITIKVKGVTCKNDLVTLSDNMKDIKGVTECKSVKSGPVSEFQVTFKKALVGTKEIFSVIENTPGCGDPKDRPYKVKNIP